MSTFLVVSSCSALAYFYVYKRNETRPCYWYAWFLGFAFAASPPVGMSSSDQYFGAGSGCMYTISLNYFNTNLIFWNLVYHIRLCALGEWGSARYAGAVGCVMQLGISKMQSMSERLSQVDADNCHIMLLCLLFSLQNEMFTEHAQPIIVEEGEVRQTSTSKFRPSSAHNSVSLFFHVFCVISMFIHPDPLSMLFDIDVDVDRKKQGLYMPSNVAALQWLIGYMFIELMYLIEQRMRAYDPTDVMINILVDVSKLTLSLKSSHYLWTSETWKGEYPNTRKYLATTAVHVAFKIITITTNCSNFFDKAPLKQRYFCIVSIVLICVVLSALVYPHVI